jgi:dipeptidyl-peptidase-4
MVLAAGLSIASLSPAPLAAQITPATDSLLHRLFASRDFAPERMGQVRWLDDGAFYTTLEPSRDVPGAEDIVRYATATGARSVLVSARQLRRPKADGTAGPPLRIEDYSWSSDGSRLLVFTNGHRNWHHGNTIGDYWVLDLHTGALRQLGGPTARPASLRFAKFAPTPQGDRIAYVRDHDIYVERLSDGAITRLTHDGSDNILNGEADWVNEEELYIRDAFRWSPDGRSIAYWQFDQSGVSRFLLIDNTDSLYPFTISQPYPHPGTTNSAVRVGVVSADGGPTTWVQLPGDPRQNYVAYMEWAGPRQLLLQHLNRHQNRDDVVLADAATGAVHTVFTERDSAWVDVDRDVRWIDGGRRFLWVSERDGWRHVYVVTPSTGTLRLVTPGAYDVEGIAGVDEPHRWLYVNASPTNATQRYLYRVSLESPGAPERISPARESGTHSYDIAPNGRWAMHTFSTFDTPPATELVSLPNHSTVRTLATNERLRSAAAPLISRPVEFFHVPVAGGVTLDGWMLRPHDFDSTKTYPILVYVYGEPAAQTVLDRWGGPIMLWQRVIADQGYIVLSVDNQGTPAPKGRAWRKMVYGAIGPLASRQQAEAIRALARTRPYLDSTRVAVWGHSGGGSQTLNALFRYPDLYKVGMAIAAVPDQLLYDSIYEERYVGLPGEDPEAYRISSPINFAQGLEGKLLFVHGTGDDNVHFQGAETLANRLVALGKSFDFVEYPNRSHCVCEGQNTSLNLRRLLTQYLLANLPAGGR